MRKKHTTDDEAYEIPESILEDYEGFEEDELDPEDSEHYKRAVQKAKGKKSDKTPEEIMEKYNKGKALMKASEPVLRETMGLPEKAKITISQITQTMVADEEKRKEFQEAVKDYQSGLELTSQAKEEMVDFLDLFIYYIIERNFNTFKKYTKDLYQEGVIGILKGIDQYDPKQGKPTTFFFVYIRHEMVEFINQNINKTTSHYSANITKVKKAIGRFEHEGREWTISDIAKETGISAETIMQSLRIMESSKEIHYESVDFLDSKTSKLYDSPEDSYLKREKAEILHNAVMKLPKDEAKIFILRYGLDGSEGLSYKGISEKLHIEVGKIRKLHNAGLQKLRNDRTITGTYHLGKESKAIQSNRLGYVPIDIGEKIMADLDKVDI